MEKTQPKQNSQYSQYARGVATGILVAGTLGASASVIHSYVHPGIKIPIPAGMSMAASTLKEISISLAGGISGLLTASATSSFLSSTSNISGRVQTGPESSSSAIHVIQIISTLSGAASSCVTLTAARIIEKLF